MSQQQYDKKFWLQNLGALFSSIQLVPTPNMTLENQCNAMTRFILLVSIVMYLFNFRYTPHFLVLSLLFIIIVFYIQRQTMKKRENYVEYFQTQKPRVIPTRYDSGPTAVVSYQIPEKKQSLTILDPPSFLNKEYHLDRGESSYETSHGTSFNGKLYGKPNPKTLVSPVVKPHSHDLDYWRDNNLITHSAINGENRQQDKYLSGYAVSTMCDSISEQELQHTDNRTQPGLIGGGIPPYTEMYQPRANLTRNMEGEIVSPKLAEFVPKFSTQENYTDTKGEIVSPKVAEFVPKFNTVEEYTGRENFQYPKTLENQPKIVTHNESGWVNTACGYNPEQIDKGLPSNLAVPNCSQSENLTEFNRNLHTQIVTPGVYSKNNVNNPVNNNMGISFQQQFEPVSCNRDDKGLTYTLHDPRVVEPVNVAPPKKPTPNYANVFDPRFYGYGTSYRTYTDPMLGQTKFLYDDVNAVRMPNYVTRSKIDFLPYADTYDTQQPGEEHGNPHNAHIRTLVQDSWLKNSIDFRNDLTERRMRKINAEAWRRKQAPLGPNLL